MAHQHDLDEHWPPSHLVDYLRAAPADGPRLSVIPRPRSAEKAPDKLAYLNWEGMIPRLAAARSIEIGYGGRPEADLPILGEFSADYVAEIAIGVAGGASWDGIKLLSVSLYGRYASSSNRPSSGASRSRPASVSPVLRIRASMG